MHLPDKKPKLRARDLPKPDPGRPAPEFSLPAYVMEAISWGLPIPSEPPRPPPRPRTSLLPVLPSTAPEPPTWEEEQEALRKRQARVVRRRYAPPSPLPSAPSDAPRSALDREVLLRPDMVHLGLGWVPGTEWETDTEREARALEKRLSQSPHDPRTSTPTSSDDT